MLIGAMNHPKRPVLQEIEWMAETGLDFVDLTLEPPAAASWRVNVEAIRGALEKHELAVVGHTAYYLPLASPFEPIRRAAVEELKRCLEIFKRLGVAWMNIHPDRNIPLHDRKYEIERNLESLREVSKAADDLGIGLMIENIPGHFNSAIQLGQILDAMPQLGLHLDIGHCNLWMDRVTNTSEEILAAYGHRLRHVHLHDNRGGGADLHLPLGTGTLDLPSALRALRTSGYDGTITLEVFSPDRSYLAHSRDVLRRAWEEAGKEVRVAA